MNLPLLIRNIKLAFTLSILFALVAFLSFAPSALARAEAGERLIRIEADNFAFAPGIIKVRPGERVTIELVSKDVAHGLSIDGYSVEMHAEPGQPARFTFLADRAGSFIIRCIDPCGNLHPFMTGRLVVGSSTLRNGSALAAVFLLLGMVLAAPRLSGATGSITRHGKSDKRPIQNIESSRVPGWLRSRWPQFGVQAFLLGGLVLTIIGGLFGSVVGSSNLAIILVWIAWWTAYKLLMIPLGGRSWCSVCPIPLPGQWIKQGGVLGKGQGIGLNLAWPKRIGRIPVDGAWLQSAAFLFVGLFAAATLTQPRLTGWVLLGVLALATVLSLVFEKRAFCNHLCPIGGFCSQYSQVAPVEVRVLDRSTCAAHTEKTCYQNCSWGVYVAALKDNSPCAMCMECVRVCPYENVSVRFRPFGEDVNQARKTPRLDETVFGLVLVGCALAFAGLFLGPWSWLRSAAYSVGTLPWAIYAAGFLAFSGMIVPGLYMLLVKFSMPGVTGWKQFKQEMNHAARPLVPSGLGLWAAFTVSFAFAKLGYILPVLTDPFGRGWDLFGLGGLSTAIAPWMALVSPLIQAAILLGSLVWAVSTATRPGKSTLQALPIQAFCLAVTLAMIFLLL